MYKDEEIVSFMDFLDLDEEVIDLKAKSIMNKKEISNKQLRNLIYLFQYKHLINIREDNDCENDEEYNFLGKLIVNANIDNVDIICTVINLVLTLNPDSIIYRSEHLLQQILSDIYLPPLKSQEGDGENEKLQAIMVSLKICGSILNALKKNGKKLSLPFLGVPLEHIVCSENKELQLYFLKYSVPQFFELIDNFHILDRIWYFLKQLNDSSIALKVICCLSNYYLPALEKSENIFFESSIIGDHEFWDFLLNGLLCADRSLERKQSIYLAKRAIDYAVIFKKNINIESKTTFIWSCDNEDTLKKMWDNYFILIDSLEEKQSNIVLPSLKLFESIKDIGHCWVVAAFNIGLKHDSSQVRLKCLHYRLNYKISNELEAITILDVINDATLSEYIEMNNSIIKQLNRALSDSETLVYILQGMVGVKWSPVPLYSLTSNLAGLQISIKDSEQNIVVNSFYKILKITCNNIVIRRAIHINISHFIAKCLKNLPWKEYIGLYPLLEIEYTNTENCFVNFVKNHMSVPDEDTKQMLNILTSSYCNIQFALIHFSSHNDTKFIETVGNMIDKIQNISSRHYSNKLDCLNDAIFVTHMYKFQKETSLFNKMNSFQPLMVVIQYIASLISSNFQLDIDEINLLLEGFGYIISSVNMDNHKEILIQIYKSANLLLRDSKTDFQNKLFALSTINVLLKSSFYDCCANKILNSEALANVIQNLKITECNKENGGRLRNAFCEKLCEVLYILNVDRNLTDVIYFMDVVIECGGYGCLKWILKVINKIISNVLDEDVKFDLAQFLNRVWREIEEIKSNSQYSTCIEQFVILITQEAILKREMYNDLVLLYFTKILNYASIKFSPLHFLVKQLSLKSIASYKYLVSFLSELLVYANIPTKEQRIADKIEVKILEQPNYYGIDYELVQFNSHIQYLSVSILSKIHDAELLNILMSCVKRRIDELFNNKVRYHENSYLERSIESALQCLLIIVIKSREVDIPGTAVWCMELLGRMPHQPYVKLCLEWYISLYFYLEKRVVDEDMLHQLKSKNVPLMSQFKILYWIIIDKIHNASCSQSEFDFAMDFFSSHSMGPTYSVRIYAQYLATGILNVNHNAYTKKYTFIRKVMQNCLLEATKMQEKTFMTLLNDYFYHGFGIIRDLSFSQIYYNLPLACHSPYNNRNCHRIFTKYFLSDIAKDINESISVDLKDKFLDIFGRGFPVPVKLISYNLYEEINDEEESQTIQKKYVPWKNMSNIDVYDIEKRTASDLILVASLIDKLPNLGGMARTGEVFGVHTYVVDSFRHLQTKVFQDLSVSAERWVNVEEVRPGDPLKEYLILKKAEGYTIVAAEQTSSSVKLQDYKFKKKTLLLLGHEKEGISCDLLPYMDHCVEIPQQGVIRSLNVHVTAAIFVWEYTRQHML